jgi:hypothetical protein
VRCHARDRLTLATITWVHSQLPATESIPAAFADGDCMIWPFLHIAPTYFFPFLEQKGLLYQPLLFHEFGHLLYVCHKREMDDFVGEFQRKVEDVLAPPSQRNDQHADIQAGQRQTIVDTWYRWSQELFCDAVGLTIGGPSFIRASIRCLGNERPSGTFIRVLSPSGCRLYSFSISYQEHGRKAKALSIVIIARCGPRLGKAPHGFGVCSEIQNRVSGHPTIQMQKEDVKQRRGGHRGGFYPRLTDRAFDRCQGDRVGMGL